MRWHNWLARIVIGPVVAAKNEERDIKTGYNESLDKIKEMDPQLSKWAGMKDWIGSIDRLENTEAIGDEQSLDDDKEQRRKELTHKPMALEDAEEEEDDSIEEIKSTKSSESEKETIEDPKELEQTKTKPTEHEDDTESLLKKIEDEAAKLLKKIEKWCTKNEIVELKMIEEKLNPMVKAARMNPLCS
ncbi:hypothetical protein PPACK8108_LOCUS22832 [Phakopsora pachyrhizi]|uniref:Uncharacterized protein n=1 Tax=Phakopsora pachyrhizi TaxID=170000 RepID=A0AAV0BN85_PHAPC|nr:hypothetical protein PPACK8108_LOCUS22832 [Phakopsora pachyrhizi]